MDIKKEIENIISEYESKLKTVFIKVIDETIAYARNNNYSSINTYLLVYDKIEEMLRCISTNLGYSSKDKYVLSQTFIEEIYNYINPLYLDAEEEIRNKALDLHDILYLGNFIDEFKEFEKIIEEFDKREIQSIYESIKLERVIKYEK